MAVGRTPQLSWGLTYMHANTSDYFIEDVRPKPEATGAWQYRRGDEWHDYTPRVEKIGRKGTEPLEELVYQNDVGTLTEPPTEAGQKSAVGPVATVTAVLARRARTGDHDHGVGRRVEPRPPPADELEPGSLRGAEAVEHLGDGR